jgi:hypothetical protein
MSLIDFRGDRSTGVDGTRDLERVVASPDQPRLVFQPIVDLARGVAAGYETLARFDAEPFGTAGRGSGDGRRTRGDGPARCPAGAGLPAGPTGQRPSNGLRSPSVTRSSSCISEPASAPTIHPVPTLRSTTSRPRWERPESGNSPDGWSPARPPVASIPCCAPMWRPRTGFGAGRAGRAGCRAHHRSLTHRPRSTSR